MAQIHGLSHSDPVYLALLVEHFEPYYSRLPGYDSDSDDCKPVDGTATTWGADEFAGFGSYSNFQVPTQSPSPGEDAHLDNDIEALRKGCPERGLWLAGEHTAPFVALGTVTGAWWSGEAVGERVVRWFEGMGDEGEKQGEEEKEEKGKEKETAQVGKGGIGV